MNTNTTVHSIHHLSLGTFASVYLQICASGRSHIQIPMLHNLNSKHYIDNAKFTQEIPKKSIFMAPTLHKAVFSGNHVKTLNF